MESACGVYSCDIYSGTLHPRRRSTLHLPIPSGNVDLAGLASGGFLCLLVSSVKTPRSLENPPAGEEGECAPHLVLWFVPDRPGKGRRG
jgi:hypothetical protein